MQSLVAVFVTKLVTTGPDDPVVVTDAKDEDIDDADEDVDEAVEEVTRCELDDDELDEEDDRAVVVVVGSAPLDVEIDVEVVELEKC